MKGQCKPVSAFSSSNSQHLQVLKNTFQKTSIKLLRVNMGYSLSPKFIYSSTICLFVLSVCLIIQSFFIPSVIDDNFYHDIINMKVMTRNKQYNDDNDYKQWVSDYNKKDADLHLYEYWLYNITNPFEASTGSTPQMQSIGPFVYKRLETKSNIIFDDDDSIVSYTYHYQYEFQPDKSTSISPDEYIWTISESMMGLFHMVNMLFGDKAFSVMPCIDEAIYNWPSYAIFHHNSIHNFIINGYSDPYIDSDSVCQGDPLWNILRPDTWGKLARDGDNNVAEYTGIGNIEKLRELIMYQNWSRPLTNSNKLITGDMWPGSNETVEPSRQIIQFPPSYYVNTSSELTIWSPEKMRKINYYFDQYVYYDTIQLLRFRMNDTELNNCSVTPSNCQFDQNWKKGVFNLTNLHDTPRFLSKSRFLNASKYFIDESMIRFGLNPPNPSIDDDYFDVDPISGLVFRKYHSFQINIRMIEMNRPYPTNFTNISFFGDLVPFTNIFIKGNISIQQSELYLNILNKINIWKTLSIYAPILSGFIFCLIIVIFCKTKTKNININQNMVKQRILIEREVN